MRIAHKYTPSAITSGTLSKPNRDLISKLQFLAIGLNTGDALCSTRHSTLPTVKSHIRFDFNAMQNRFASFTCV
ncbi:MAG: hypothetical protein MUF22_09935 [Chitinispirillaceae bacterium]|jgi:hypothetical protein|nr:hypothetical protein [Chitinispirillaceae bacterium]